ncbi:hypothetical protein Tco_0700014, partial [Tanacetum coccineum]
MKVRRCCDGDDDDDGYDGGVIRVMVLNVAVVVLA